MSKLDKARQTMKEFYSTKELANLTARLSATYGNELAYVNIYSSHLSAIQSKPWQAFSATKPVIDKRRARRYHRKHISKLKSEGALLVKAIEIDNTLPNGSGYHKQLAEQLELQGKLEVAISNKVGE